MAFSIIPAHKAKAYEKRLPNSLTSLLYCSKSSIYIELVATFTRKASYTSRHRLPTRFRLATSCPLRSPLARTASEARRWAHPISRRTRIGAQKAASTTSVSVCLTRLAAIRPSEALRFHPGGHDVTTPIILVLEVGAQ